MQPVDFEAVPNLNLGVVVMNQAPEGARVPGDAAGSDGAGGGVDVGGVVCCKGTRHCLCTFHPATSVESDRPETALAAD